MLSFCHHNFATPVFFEQQTNLWDSLWPQLAAGIVSSFIGIAGAYGLFLNGLRKDKEKERQKAIVELSDYFSYIVFSIKRIVRPTISQIESFKKLCKQLEEKKALDYHFSEVASFNFKWFDEMNKSKAQKAFFENFPGTNNDKYYFYNQLLRSIDLLSLISRDYKQNFERFLSNSNLYHKTYTEVILEMMTMRDEIVAKTGNTGRGFVNLNALEIDIFKASENWYSIPWAERFDIYVTQSTWIVPLSKMQNLYTDPDLQKKIRHLNNAHGNFKRNHDHILGTFQNYVKSMTTEILRIQVILRRIENK